MKILQSMVAVLLLSTMTVSLAEAKVGGIDAECQDFGFESGVAKWEWNFGWYPEGSDLGTRVWGNDTVAHWDVGTSNAIGILVKGGSPNSPQNYMHYAIWGMNGTVEEESPAVSHITFCYNENEIPEFSSVAAIIALIGAASGYLYIKRK